jgi:hypothetical protein
MREDFEVAVGAAESLRVQTRIINRHSNPHVVVQDIESDEELWLRPDQITRLGVHRLSESGRASSARSTAGAAWQRSRSAAARDNNRVGVATKFGSLQTALETTGCKKANTPPQQTTQTCCKPAWLRAARDETKLNATVSSHLAKVLTDAHVDSLGDQ